ncbi:MAG: DegT/DnrJ/EryC1/StrS family aminotransferase [Candidatus Omnitrophota bacterium]
MRIPFGTVSVTQKSKDLIKGILDSNRLSSGKFVRLFEKEFARLVGAKEAVAVSSGTDANTIALATLHDFGCQEGDEVIVPALSFIATGTAVLHARFKPVFVDIEQDTLNIDPALIDEAITKKTKAIMPVHLMGKPAAMDEVNAIARKHNLFVIEDAAEAHGAVYKGKNAGTLADMGCFSLYVAHIITTGEGGIVVTDNPDFAEILRSLRSHGRACKCNECVLNLNSGCCQKRFSSGKGEDIRFLFERIGYSCKMNEMEAAVGLGNLDIYHGILEKRRENFYYLADKFKQFAPYLMSIELADYEKLGPHAFPVIIQSPDKIKREALTRYLEKNSIDTRTVFCSMPTQFPGFRSLGYKLGDFPNAEYIGDNAIHIGIHQDLDKAHLDYFIDVVSRFLSELKIQLRKDA